MPRKQFSFLSWQDAAQTPGDLTGDDRHSQYAHEVWAEFIEISLIFVKQKFPYSLLIFKSNYRTTLLIEVLITNFNLTLHLDKNLFGFILHSKAFDIYLKNEERNVLSKFIAEYSSFSYY